MRVLVDLNRCLGYAQCAFLASDLFRLSGEETLARGSQRRRVRRAIAAGPVQAITVERLDGRERPGRR